jgi:GTP-binding protein EngB required for normal cell division
MANKDKSKKTGFFKKSLKVLSFFGVGSELADATDLIDSDVVQDGLEAVAGKASEHLANKADEIVESKKDSVADKVKSAVKDEVKSAVKDEVKSAVKDEVISAIKDELKSKVSISNIFDMF